MNNHLEEKNEKNPVEKDFFPFGMPHLLQNKHRSKAEKDIMQAALKEFAAYGLTGSRIDRIAKASSYNKAMIYYYFKSKEKLYESVIFTLDFQSFENGESSHPLIRFYEKYIKDRTVRFEDLDEKNYFEFLEQYINCIMKTFSLRSDDYNKIIMYEMASGGKYLFQVRDKMWIPGFKMFDYFLSLGLKKGYFHTFDTYFVILSFMGTLMFYYVNKPILKDSELKDKFYLQDSEKKLTKHLYSLIEIYRKRKPENNKII